MLGVGTSLGGVVGLVAGELEYGVPVFDGVDVCASVDAFDHAAEYSSWADFDEVVDAGFSHVVDGLAPADAVADAGYEFLFDVAAVGEGFGCAVGDDGDGWVFEFEGLDGLDESCLCGLHEW